MAWGFVLWAVKVGFTEPRNLPPVSAESRGGLTCQPCQGLNHEFSTQCPLGCPQAARSCGGRSAAARVDQGGRGERQVGQLWGEHDQDPEQQNQREEGAQRHGKESQGQRGTQNQQEDIQRDRKTERRGNQWGRDESMGLGWMNPETTAQNTPAPWNTHFLLETGALSQAPAPPLCQCSLGSKPPNPHTPEHSRSSRPWLGQRDGSGGGGYGCWDLK